MQNWNLGPGDPLQLTLAADARLSPVSFTDDQIWELNLTDGEPPAVDLRTTFGLRARIMRIYPRFLQGPNAIHNPADFVESPRIHKIHPNYIELTFAPLPGLRITAEYWAAGSQVVCGRISAKNSANIALTARLDIVCQLIPIEGQVMTVAEKQELAILEGKAGNLSPVFYLTGGPQPGPGPYASLTLPLDLAPGEQRKVTWALASLPDPEESFQLARRTVARPFDAEKSRIELLNASQVIQITTGDPDWNLALALSQKTAFGLLHSPADALPNLSFVQARQPDQGYSLRGDGLDHSHLWAGQTPFDSLYLARLIPGAPRIAQGLLENFLAIQEQDGFIDMRPGLAGQRLRLLAAPALAGQAWALYNQTRDVDFLKRVFAPLRDFFWAWFSPLRDQDGNGLPEWQSVRQTGFEENPLFDGWHAWAQGIEINTVQSPALSAALYHEAHCLMGIAETLGRKSEIPLLQKQAEILRAGVEQGWDADAAFFHYVDRDTHLSLPGKTLSERQAPSSLELQKEFKQPVRLLFRIQGEGEAIKRPRVTIRGLINGQEQTETLSRQDFNFSPAGAVATSQKVYTAIGQFEFEGLNRRDRIAIQTVDLTVADHTLLLPLWAGIPSEQEAQAIVFRTILDAARFDHPFGIPALPKIFAEESDPVCMSVHLPWNTLIGAGMLRYGYRRETARLVAHLMAAVIQNLKRSQAFYRAYHAESGQGLGERNSLHGLAPVGLFLDTLGVEIISDRRVRLRGENPFPWPVTVKYRGLTVSRQMRHTEINFPNGQTVNQPAPADVEISCE